MLYINVFKILCEKSILNLHLHQNGQPFQGRPLSSNLAIMYLVSFDQYKTRGYFCWHFCAEVYFQIENVFSFLWIYRIPTNVTLTQCFPRCAAFKRGQLQLNWTSWGGRGFILCQRWHKISIIRGWGFDEWFFATNTEYA